MKIEDLSNFKLQVLTIDNDSKSHIDQVVELLDSGCRWIQYRNKKSHIEERKQEATEISKLCNEKGATFIVNDSIEVAIASKASGVHLGQKDIHPQVARNLLGKNKIIGCTINTLEQAEFLRSLNVADYYGVGPFNMTQTKENLAPILTTKEFEEIQSILMDTPSVLIGGINESNIESAIQLGFKGIAISSAIAASHNIKESYLKFENYFNEISEKV